MPRAVVPAQSGGPRTVAPLARRPGVRERWIRPRPWLNGAYRAVVGVVGSLVIVLGAVLLPLPGPGWLVIFVGLGVLATEFAWAERLLRYARARVRRWTDWVQAQTLAVRAGIAAAGLLAVGVAGAAYLLWKGVPAWVPVVQ